ncbi:13890_t:CDS:2, partial [Dentiscutata heterogama]
INIVSTLINTNNMEYEIDIKEMTYNYDWSSTSLGPMDTWEPLLKTAVDFCLNSRFPFAIYCAMVPIVRENHPSGKADGEYRVGTFNPIYRKNYTEESYFSYSISAIYKEDGSFLAILNLSADTTRKVLANRRLKCLNDLEIVLGVNVESLENGSHIIVNTLHENNKNIPFTLIYFIDGNESDTSFEPRIAYLAATTFDSDSKVNDKKSKRCIPDNLLETPEFIDLIKNVDENYDKHI